jgi:hypothetical protein
MIVMQKHTCVNRMHELSIKAKTQPPSWAAEPLRSIPKDKYIHLKRFLHKRYRSHHGVVAFDDIDSFISSVGDLRVDWNGLLHVCKKNNLVESYLWNADYWTDPSRKEGVSFVKLDDNLLISRGLYRTTLARYALHYYGADTLYGVKLSRWAVDWDLFNTWLALKEACAEKHPRYVLSPEKKKISRYREGHWVIDEYLLALRCEDRDSGKVKTMGGLDAKDWLVDLTAGEEPPRFGLERLKARALAA